ncbi:MAG: hypothetical protein IPO10_13670 [Flavobacteriales bacterium]|nr:hypothetical protein [Flavobacteriales bacterium]HQX30904.1 hypothetical protein [Flavobacteriales bacterium]HQX39390.1 hypothetical protein [Flavobacteriales bacterium]
MELSPLHSMITVLDEPYLSIRRSANNELIHLEWKGHARSDQYRSSLELALDIVVKFDLVYWIADLREMTAILKSDEQWANEVWFPKLFDSRLEKMAILESSDYFNQTSVQRSFTAVHGQLTFKVAWFPKPSEALDWIFQQEAVSV